MNIHEPDSTALPSKSVPSKSVPSKSVGDSESQPAPAPRSRYLLLLVALALGLVAGLATLGVGRRDEGAPVGQVQLILDEDQIGWPFYGAAQEQAVAILENPAALGVIKTQIDDPSQAVGVKVIRPGDLSLLTVEATASSKEAAVQLADAAVSYLVESSRQDRAATETAQADRLAEEILRTESELAVLTLALDNATDESQATVARSQLEETSRAYANMQEAATNLGLEIERIDSAFRPISQAQLKPSKLRPIASALAAAAATTILSLLALSFVRPDRGSATARSDRG